MESFWRVALGYVHTCPRSRCALQRPLLVRGIAYCQKPNSFPFLGPKNSAERRNGDCGMHISAVTGGQAKAGTEMN